MVDGGLTLRKHVPAVLGGDPGVGDSGVGDPGVGDPGRGDPGVGDPGVGDPGVGDPTNLGVGDLVEVDCEDRFSSTKHPSSSSPASHSS